MGIQKESRIQQRERLAAYEEGRRQGRCGRGYLVGNALAIYEKRQHISNVKFEWDETKAASNFAKHRVEFEFAARVFSDPARITSTDLRHPAEHRENTTGLVDGLLFITVTHTDRAGITRLISARRASRQERKHYYGPR